MPEDTVLPNDRASRPAIARRRPVLYPAIVTSAWALMLYVSTSVSPYAAARVLLVAFGAGLIAAWVGGIILRDRDRGALLGLLSIVAILYGERLALLALLVVVAVLLIVLGRVAPGDGRLVRWRSVTRLMTGLSVVLLLAIGIKAAQTGVLTATLADLIDERPFLRTEDHGTAPGGAPDIFVILLDSYARSDLLMDRFGLDEHGFVDALAARGLATSPSSRSNYLLTQLTLASMLNMAHLDDLGGPVGMSSSDPASHRETRALINDNELFRRLRDKGYAITSIAPGWEDVAIRRADRFIDTGPVNEFEIVSLHSTAIWSLLEQAAPHVLLELGRARVQRSVDSLMDVASESSNAPRLVLAHLSTPHPPFVFGAINEHPGDISQAANYEITADGRMRDDQYKERYAAQVPAVDALVVDALDRLDAVIDPGSVVIVMSDHGSRSTVDWNDLQPSDLDERSANFFAARTPGHPDLFGPAPTPVNLFGTLLSAYLGDAVPARPDDVYYWKGDAPFDTVRITDVIGDPGPP